MPIPHLDVVLQDLPADPVGRDHRGSPSLLGSFQGQRVVVIAPAWTVEDRDLLVLHVLLSDAVNKEIGPGLGLVGDVAIDGLRKVRRDLGSGGQLLAIHALFLLVVLALLFTCLRRLLLLIQLFLGLALLLFPGRGFGQLLVLLGLALLQLLNRRLGLRELFLLLRLLRLQLFLGGPLLGLALLEQRQFLGRLFLLGLCLLLLFLDVFLQLLEGGLGLGQGLLLLGLLGLKLLLGRPLLPLVPLSQRQILEQLGIVLVVLPLLLGQALLLLGGRFLLLGGGHGLGRRLLVTVGLFALLGRGRRRRRGGHRTGRCLGRG